MTISNHANEKPNEKLNEWHKDVKNESRILFAVYGFFILGVIMLYVSVVGTLNKRGVWMQEVSDRLERIENGK